MALTYLQLSPAVHFVRHLGLSPLRDIEMQGRGAAATDVPLQKELWSIFFSTGAIIQFLNHHFAWISLHTNIHKGKILQH